MVLKKRTLEEQSAEAHSDLKSLFKPSTELEALRGLKIGFHGLPKVGKTHLALTAPPPRYVIDTEGSVKINILQFPKEHREETYVAEVVKYADIKTHRVDLTQSLDAAFDAIDALTLTITEKEAVGETGTVIVDSASDIWSWLTIWLEDITGKSSLHAGQMPRFEWGKANRRYTDFIYMLIRSNWNVIMTFRSAPAVNNKGEDLGYNTAKWQKNTPYWLDVIGEVQHDGVQPTFTFRGDRFGRLNETIVWPTWDKIVEALVAKTGVTI